MRNVVLICLDSVRKDVFDEHAPRLRSRADLSYDQCRAASSWSVPSHASMLTGSLPSDHGVHSHNLDFSTIDPGETAFSDRSGYRTLSVSANGFTNEAFGFDSLFDECLTVRHTQRFPAGLDAGEKSIREIVGASIGHDHAARSLANGVASKLYWLVDALPVPQVFDQGAGLIRRHAREKVAETSEPFFLFLNFMEAHVPHKHFRGFDSSVHAVDSSWSSTRLDYGDLNRNRPESLERNREDVENFRELYAASVEYLDRQVTQLIDSIGDVTSGETTVVVTADHGENLGYPAEDFLLEHTASLSEGLLHVPLVVIDPPSDGCRGGSGFVSHLALPELLSSLAEGTVPDVRRERIPAEIVGGGIDVDADDPFWDRMIRCAYAFDAGEKFEWDSLGTETAYSLDHTRPCWQATESETVDLPQWTRGFFERPIAEAKATAREPGTVGATDDLGDGVRRRLEDLGYL